MMEYTYGYGTQGAMMAGGNVFGLLIYLVILVDLVLLGIFLWQKISHK